MKKLDVIKIIWGIVFLGLIDIPVFSQSNVSMGLLPRVNLSFDLNDKFKLNNSLESRNVLFEAFDQDLTYHVTINDISSILSYKTSANTRLNAGYLLRLVDGNPIHRSIQQFNLLSSFPAIRLGHRFAADQNFSSKLPPQYRFRYRITIEKPLNGTRLDPQEFYFKASNEIIYATRAGSSDVEYRIKPVIGYLFQHNNKLELGIDYRFNEFVVSAIDHDFWISITWYSAFGRKKS